MKNHSHTSLTHHNRLNVVDEFTESTKKIRGSTVVKVLGYKSECRWFDPRWCQKDFSLT